MMLVFRPRSILRFGLFVIIALALIWYVNAKRSDFYRQSAEKTEEGPAVPATAPVRSPSKTEDQVPTGNRFPTNVTSSSSGLSLKDFFAEYRLDRDRARAGEIQTLRELAGNLALGESGRKDAGSKLMRLTERASQEVQTEGLLKAKGFEDALVILREGSAEVIIRTPSELTRAQLAIIADVVTRNTGVKAAKLSISTRP